MGFGSALHVCDFYVFFVFPVFKLEDNDIFNTAFQGVDGSRDGFIKRLVRRAYAVCATHACDYVARAGGFRHFYRCAIGSQAAQTHRSDIVGHSLRRKVGGNPQVVASGLIYHNLFIEGECGHSVGKFCHFCNLRCG